MTVRLPSSRYLLGAALVLLGGCGDQDPVIPGPSRVAIDPHPVFSILWNEVQECSGLTGDLAGISWFVTTGFDRAETLGQWNSDREITLRIDRWTEFMVVKHEMLHDLLRGDGEHRDRSWIDCNLPRG